MALRDTNATGALLRYVLRTQHGLHEGSIHNMQLRERDEVAKGSVHGLPSGLRDQICLAVTSGASADAVYGNDLQAAGCLPSGSCLLPDSKLPASGMQQLRQLAS